jgi:hypothetical protein
MFKKRYFSTQHDFKSGILCKLSLFFGFLFLGIYLFFVILSFVLSSESQGFLKQLYDISKSSTPVSIVSLAMILIFAGIVLYLFSCQLAKLDKIADEIEKGEEFLEEETD